MSELEQKVKDRLNELHNHIVVTLKNHGTLQAVMYHVLDLTPKQIKKFESGDVGFMSIKHTAKLNAMYGYEVFSFNKDINS